MGKEEKITFKKMESITNIDKPLRKAGLSFAIIFSKEEVLKCNLSYGDIIRLDKAEIIKKEKYLKADN